MHLNILHICVLLVVLPLRAVADDYQIVNWTTTSVFESYGIAFVCPTKIVDWIKTTTFDDKDTIVKFYSIYPNDVIGFYGCAGSYGRTSANNDGICIDGVYTDSSTGSRVEVRGLTFANAGAYGCHFRASDTTYQMQWFNLTVVSSNSPTFLYVINGMTRSIDPSRPVQVSQGTSITVICSTTYAGFNDPGLQLGYADIYGNDAVLKVSPSIASPTLSTSGTTLLSNIYKVLATDNTFSLWCDLRNLKLQSRPFQMFQRTGPTYIEQTTRFPYNNSFIPNNIVDYTQSSANSLLEGASITTAVRVVLSVIATVVVYI